MKTTTTIFDIIQSELINMGLNEFQTKNKMVYVDHKFQFIQKAMQYDKDIQQVAEKMFFKGISLDNPDHDLLFKKTFINRFLNRQLAFQTVESFASQVVYVFLTHIDFLNMYYENIDKYITGTVTNSNSTKGDEIGDFRNANATLPQTEVNIDVDNTVLNYADENTINRNKIKRNNTGESESKNYKLSDLVKSKKILQSVFNDFDRKCFLQIW